MHASVVLNFSGKHFQACRHEELGFIQHTALDINKIEAVQKKAARWICAKWNSSNFSWDMSYDDCLHELNWPSLAI